MGITNIIALLSGVALFLFGMTIMGDGLKKVAGSKLELVLYKLSGNPVKGVLLGTGVTAVIQSSSATSVMVVGFVNSGIMKVNQAIGIILGAILGTSITGWIICLSYIDGGGEATGLLSLLSTSTLTGIVAVIGIILRMFCKKQVQNHIGDILMGFAVLMFGMQAMSSAVAPLRESEPFLNLLTTFSNPLLGILVGLLFTMVLQSASAAVGILQALAATGVITFAVGFPLIMGIAIGAALPVLLSSFGANVNGKRTAFTYLLVDVCGVIIWGIIFYAVNAVVHFPFMSVTMDTVGIAFVNTAFRFATVLVLTPFIGLMEKMVCRLFEDNESGREQEDFARLETRFIEHPALAVEQCREAIKNMALEAKANLEDAYFLLETFSEKGYQFVARREDIVDKYEDKLGSYLIKITEKELSHSQNQDITKFLHTISDLERISDHAMNIAECAKEIHEKKITFSEPAQKELRVLFDAVNEICYNVVMAFISNDVEAAYHIEPLEEVVDTLCDAMKLHHVDRLQRGMCRLNQGFVFNDLVTNYERIGDHCSNIALAMIELESDSFDTHEYITSLKQVRTHRFDEYFEEYSRRFALPEEE